MADYALRANPNLNEIQIVQNMLNLLPTTERPAHQEDVVFVCLDCEAYEFNPKKVTEVGVAVLDTRLIQGIPPGADGEVAAWISKIEYAHYRPKEYKNLVNKKFIKSYPDSFAFGETIWTSVADMKHILRRIFHSPSELLRVHQRSNRAPNHESEPLEPEYRNVVLVGHALSNEISFLRTLGLDVSNVTNIVQRKDTQALAGPKKHPASLKRVLTALGLHPQHLHNAGNDAAWTLHAMLLMVVREFNKPGSLAACLQETYDADFLAKQISLTKVPADNAQVMNPAEGPTNSSGGVTSNVNEDGSAAKLDQASRKRQRRAGHFRARTEAEQTEASGANNQ